MRITGLSFGMGEGGRLMVPATPGSSEARLFAEPDGARVECCGATVTLPWSAFTPRTSPLDGGTSNSWGVTWVTTRRGAATFGLAVTLGRNWIAPAAEVRRAAHRFSDLMVEPNVVVLQRSMFSTFQPTIDVLSALFALVRDRPDLRERLGERGRVSGLISALDNFDPKHQVARSGGIRRSTVEIRIAERMTRLVHRYGRPLPGDVMPSHDEAIARVRAALAANPHARDLHIHEHRIEELLERDYLDIEPWPFEALLIG